MLKANVRLVCQMLVDMLLVWWLTVSGCLGSGILSIKEDNIVAVPGEVRRLLVVDVDGVEIRVHYGERTSVLYYTDHHDQICEQPSQLILILIQDLKHLIHLLKRMSSASCWNARAKFLIVPANDENSSLESVLREAWAALYVLNLTVILYSSAFTFNPFIGEKGSLITVTNQDLFPDKARDLHGHLLIGSVFPNKPKVIRLPDGRYVGPDVSVFLTFTRYLNATPQLLPPSDGQMYGFRKQDGRVGGSAADVVYGRANITVNASYRKLNLSDCLEFSYPHFQDDYSVVVPMAGLVPIDRNLFLPFTLYTWIALFCSIPSAGMCFFLLFQQSTFSRCLLNCFKAFLTGAMPLKTRTLSQRMFLTVWVFCSVVITSAYQGSLTSYLVVPQSLPNIDTLLQLNSSRLILFGAEAGRLILSGDNPILTSLLQRFIPGVNTDEMLSRVAFLKDAAWLRESTVTSYHVSRTKFMGSDGQALLHLMKQSLLMKYTNFEVTPGSPVLPHLNRVVERVVVAGLYSKWTRDMLFEEILRGELMDTQHHQAPKAIQLQHLQAAFYILAAGLALSTAVFFVEVRKQPRPHEKTLVKTFAINYETNN